MRIASLAFVALTLVFAGGASLLAHGTAVSLPESALLPNLQMAPLNQWVIERTGGQRLLRFTTMFVNVGDGPMELRAFRPNREASEMQMDQVVYLADGGLRRLPAVTIGTYAGDGHNHWHAVEVSVYELWSESDPTGVRRGAKIDFCFFDDERVDANLATQARPTYLFQGCGHVYSLVARVGLSVGWGDVYDWDFVNQWIDITDLPGGTYRVRATVDMQNRFVETNNVDNCAWAQIRFEGDEGRDDVEILDSGQDCGVAAGLPVRTFPAEERFDPARGLRLAAGEHVGALLNDVGTVLSERHLGLARELVVSVSARAHPIGQPGEWYYVSSGLWAGHWMAAGPGVTLEAP